MRKLALAAALAASTAMVWPAQASAQAAEPDFAATAINQGNVESLTVFGNATKEVVDNPALPGGKALRISVAGKGANAWDAGVSSRITGAIKAGEEYRFVFYAKLVSGENGATTATLPFNNISIASPPYTPIIGKPATITTGWKRLSQPWIADKDYAAGTLQAGLQLATGKQVIDVGPIYVSKVGVAPPPTKRTVIEDLSSKVVNDPGTPEVNGARAQLLDDAKVTGGKALRVSVSQKGKNNWDSNVESSIKKPIRKGDKLILMFEARLAEGPQGASTAKIPNAAIQQKAAPYKSFFNGSPDLTGEWQSFRYEGVADKDYKADEVKATIQVGNARQKIDFGPITVVNMGQ